MRVGLQRYRKKNYCIATVKKEIVGNEIMVIVFQPLTEQRSSVGNHIAVVTFVKQLPRPANH